VCREKGKNEKTIIQLERENKIRRQPCKIGRQTCTCKAKKKFTWIMKVINNPWTIHLKNKESD
jgi:hypothetical protein